MLTCWGCCCLHGEAFSWRSAPVWGWVGRPAPPAAGSGRCGGSGTALWGIARWGWAAAGSGAQTHKQNPWALQTSQGRTLLLWVIAIILKVRLLLQLIQQGSLWAELWLMLFDFFPSPTCECRINLHFNQHFCLLWVYSLHPVQASQCTLGRGHPSVTSVYGLNTELQQKLTNTFWQISAWS